MKSMNFKQGCILSELGESRLLRAALASEFLAEVLSVPTVNGARTVSAEGAAALVACIAEQLDGVVKEPGSFWLEIMIWLTAKKTPGVFRQRKPPKRWMAG